MLLKIKLVYQIIYNLENNYKILKNLKIINNYESLKKKISIYL
jgi:hypothetical protein